LVCQNLQTLGLCSGVGPSPAPPSSSSYVWSSTQLGGNIAGRPTCFQFTPNNDLKTLGSTAFGSTLHDGPCTSLGFFTMATKCIISGGANTPYTETFPSAPAPPAGQVSLSYELAGVEYSVWMKPQVQSAPGVLMPGGRRLLGGSSPPPNYAGSTVMYMFDGPGSSVCGQFTLPFNSEYAATHFSLNQNFNVGQCQDHGYYTLLSKDGVAMTETFTSGWGQGTKYQIWVKNAVCGNIPDYTPNFYGV